MSPHDEDVVDLTLDSSEDDRPTRPPKRQRRASPADSGDVQLVEEAPQQQEQRPEQLDEDLEVLGTRGDVWNKSLPHTRDLCGKMPFDVERSLANARHCDKCYCYVCDCPATECTAWGDGWHADDHCHGHPGSAHFLNLKNQRKASARSSGGAGSSRAVARAPYSISKVTSDLIRALRAKHPARAPSQQHTSPGKAKVKPPPPPPCRLKRIPDPAKDPSMLLLARVEVRVKALGDNTIAGLRSRLAPTGFFTSVDMMPEYGDRLCLDNLLSNQWDVATSKYMPVNLKVCKMPLPPQPPEPTAQRVRQVTIMHCDGRAAPTTYGVSVHKQATLKDIMRAAELLAGLDRKTERFLGVNLSGGGLTVNFLQETLQVTDHDHGNVDIGLWRVPKASSIEGPPEYAVVFHRQRANSDYPAWDVVAQPTLLPVGKALASGGKAAEKAVMERLMAALAPLRRQPGGGESGAALTQPTPKEAARSLLAAGGKLYRTSYYGCSYAAANDASADFSHSKPVSSNLRYGEAFVRDGKLYLRVDWTPEQLADYDTSAWLNPKVDASASPEAMQPTIELIKAAAAWDAKKRHAKQLPHNMLEELKAASRCLEPGVAYPMHRRFISEPLARVVTDLVPDSNRQGEKRGKAVFSVYVWKSDRATFNRPFFQEYDAWDSTRSARREWRDLGAHPLRSVMDVLLWDDPQHKALYASVQEWRAKEQAQPRSIPGLMQALERGEMPEAEQPEGLNITMRPYQRQSLQFMLDCEKGEGGFRRLFWQRLVTPGGTPYWWSSLLGRACMDVPEQPWGGWCCEEMGLGKTIEVLGLILANPAPPLPPGVHKDAKGLIKSRATLVVCAVSLVGQWIAEAQAKLAPGRLKIHMYHGQQRIRDPVRLATEFDLVVTTYATLGADYGGKRAGGQRANFPPLGAIKWHRLVLDEAHTVKNAAVAHTKASIALQADRRWMCTGTPINTDVSDLYGQFCVLGLSPFNNKTMFDSHVKNSYGNAYGSGCPALVYTLGQVMVRHTKRQVLGGEEVLRLPPKTEELVPVVLTAEEQEMYKKAHKASAELFAQYRTLGNHSINKHLLQIMALLLPMRRVCSGGNLRPRDLVVNDPLFGEGAVVRRRRLSGAGAIAPADHNLVAPEDECPICFDMPEAPVVTPCEHWFCRDCILGVIATNPKCPLCRRAITAPDLRQGVTAAEADAEEAEAEAAAAAAKGGEGEAGAGEAPPAEQAFVSESKLQALLKELRKMRRTDPTAKALVFSQYVSTIEWLKTRLTQAGFEYRFLSGSMALKKRAKFIKEFQEAPPTTVFLLSMRSGAVGVNLTAASHVFLMEPALNPALEEQAIGRAWRMGQQRSVKVFKFYVKGSVEERIMEVVRKRTEAVAGAAAAGPAAGGGGMSSEEEADEHGLGMGHGRGRGRWGYGERTNVRMQDLAGSIHADRQQLRVEELEVLFKAPEFPQPRVPEPDSQDDEADAAAAAAAIAAATAAHQQRRAGGAAAASRKPGRRPQRAAAAAGSDEGSDSEGAGGRAGLALGRGARRRSALRRPINYAELDGASLDSDDGEEEQEEQRPVGRRRGSRRRYSGDSDEEEWAPAGDTRDQSPGSLETSGLAEEEDEDFAEEEADEEEEAEAEGEEEAGEASRERVRAGSRSKRKRAGSTAAAAAAPAANGAAHRGAAVPTSRIKQVITRKSWGPGGAPKQQAEQQQQPADEEQQQEQHQQAATGSAGPSSRPGSSSGRLSPGWAARPFSAGTGAEAPAAATGGPAAAAAGAAPQHTSRVRVPMRGARLPAALTAHLAGGSAGRGAAPSGATPAQTGDQ